MGPCGRLDLTSGAVRLGQVGDLNSRVTKKPAHLQILPLNALINSFTTFYKKLQLKQVVL